MFNTILWMLLIVAVMILISRFMTNYAKHTVHSLLEEVVQAMCICVVIFVPVGIIAMMLFGAMHMFTYAP